MATAPRSRVSASSITPSTVRTGRGLLGSLSDRPDCPCAKVGGHLVAAIAEVLVSPT
jgi:hypothetical protein